MKFFNLRGKPTFKNISKFRIDWSKQSKSKFQFNVKQFFKQYWQNHICYEEVVLAGTRLSLDILNLTERIGVEVHGDQHIKHVPFFHGKNTSGFGDQINRDLDKIKWCENNKIELIEIYSSDFSSLSKEWVYEKFNIIL